MAAGDDAAGKRRWSSDGRVLVLAIGIVIAVTVGLAAFRQPKPLWLAPGSTYFYRVHVALTHKGTPIDFDVVVGCGVKVGGDTYSGRSYDVMQWWPYIYAKAIAGGHAVMLLTNGSSPEENPCLGNSSTHGSGPTLAEPAIPSDWLPVVVWYDRAEDLSHGLAYVTKAAYERPNSDLEFHGARIDKASRTDFDHFLRTSPTNLMPSYNATFLRPIDAPQMGFNMPLTPEIRAEPWRAWPFQAPPTCRGVERAILTDAQRAAIRPLWPASHPHYWSVDPDKQVELLAGLFPKRKGIPSFLRFVTSAMEPEVFPMVDGGALGRVAANSRLEQLFTYHIAIADTLNNTGLMSCDIEASFRFIESLANIPSSAKNTPPTQRCYIDGAAVRILPDACNGTAVGRWVVFENDQAAIFNRDIQAIRL